MRNKKFTLYASIVVLAVVIIGCFILGCGKKTNRYDILSLPFGNVVKEIEKSTQAQGIKITTIAAQRYADMAVLYVTVEDTEARGRVKSDTQLVLAETGAEQLLAYNIDMIDFNAETGIAIYQIRLDALDAAFADTFPLQIKQLTYGDSSLGEVRMDINISQAVADGEHNGEPYQSDKQMPSETLTPGYIADIPGAESVWVSAIGVNHGFLTIQFGQPTNPSAVQHIVRPYLLDAQGNRIGWDVSAGFSTNEHLQQVKEIEQETFDFMEVYFKVNTDDLDGYLLCFEGSASNVVVGDWNMDIELEIGQALELNTNLVVGEKEITDALLTLHPLGMTLSVSSSAPNLLSKLAMPVVLETEAGDIELKKDSGNQPETGVYKIRWHATSGIDIKSVSAIRIGDNRFVL